MLSDLLWINSFTVSLHSPNDRQVAGNLPAVRAVQGTISSFWKLMGILTGPHAPMMRCNLREIQFIALSTTLYIE